MMGNHTLMLLAALVLSLVSIDARYTKVTREKRDLRGELRSLLYGKRAGKSSCGGTYTKAGSATSPGFRADGSGIYANDLDCKWVITAAAGQTVELRFDSLDIEADDYSGGCYDWVDIFNGLTTSATKFGQFCGKGLSQTFKSTGNSILVNLMTDYSIGMNGIKFSWTFKGSVTPTPSPSPSPSPSPTPSPTPTPSPSCGVPSVTPRHARIVGGENAIANSFPWQISLRFQGHSDAYSPNGYGHYCGGSIVASQYIVTAAHCVAGQTASQFRVRIGEHDQKTTTSAQRDIAVSKITMHPSYSSSGSANDIAVLKLAETITFNQYASPVCLPTADPNTDQIVTVTGWGNTETNDDKWSVLQQVRVPVVSQSTCNTNYVANGGVSEDMICAGQTGKDSCQGDSGGPMVYKVNGAYQLAGVVSWGVGCADAGYPGVYARVTYFNAWIRNNMN